MYQKCGATKTGRSVTARLDAPSGRLLLADDSEFGRVADIVEADPHSDAEV